MASKVLLRKIDIGHLAIEQLEIFSDLIHEIFIQEALGDPSTWPDAASVDIELYEDEVVLLIDGKPKAAKKLDSPQEIVTYD